MLKDGIEILLCNHANRMSY